MYNYLDDYHQKREYYYGDKEAAGGERGKEGFIDEDKDGVQQSQVSEEGVRTHNPHVMSNSLSVDSGIVMHPRNQTVGSDRMNNNRFHEDRDEGGNIGIPPYLITRSLGPFMHHHVSSDSDSESPSG